MATAGGRLWSPNPSRLLPCRYADSQTCPEIIRSMHVLRAVYTKVSGYLFVSTCTGHGVRSTVHSCIVRFLSFTSLYKFLWDTESIDVRAARHGAKRRGTNQFANDDTVSQDLWSLYVQHKVRTWQAMQFIQGELSLSPAPPRPRQPHLRYPHVDRCFTTHPAQ
jgi:hypothetical protein